MRQGMRRGRSVAGLAVWMLAAAWATAWAEPPTQWTPQGIGGGGSMFAPTINPANGNEMYVGCDMSPQFHSTDGGKSWRTVDFREIRGGHDSTVRFTKDPAVRWVLDYTSIGGGDEVRPKRSVDGGKSWRYLRPAWPDTRRAYALSADYQNPDRALISADYRELWITLDGGKTFEKKLDAVDRGAGLHLAGAFFDGDTIYAGLGDGLYVSKDGGRNFAKDTASGLPQPGFVASFAGGRSNGKTRLFAVTLKAGWAGINGSERGAYTGVYVLEAGQGAWAKRTEGIPPTAYPFFVKMAMTDAETAYVAGGSQGSPSVFKTVDGGRSWSDVFQTAGNRNISTGWAGDGADFRWSFPEYAFGFEVSLLDKNRLLLTDMGCAHASDDGGKTWRAVYTRPVEPRAIGPAVRGAAYACNGMEVTSVWNVLWCDPNTLIASVTDIRGYRSVDGGATWSFKYTGHDLNTMYQAVKKPYTGVVYAATASVHDLYESTYLADARIDNGRGFVLFSIDNGANWRPVGALNRPVVALALDPKNTNRLYAAVVNSKEGGIWVSNNLDKGEQATWARLPPPPRTEGHAYNVQVLKDGAVVCTFSGRRVREKVENRTVDRFSASSGVFFSATGGQSWEDRSDPRMQFWTKDLVIDPGDATESTWYAGVFHAWGPGAGAGKCGLYRTKDRGKSWTLLADSSLAPSGILNVESAACNPARPGELYFTTELDGLYYTDNANAEKPLFKPVAGFPFQHPMRVFFNPSRSAEVWVTTFGNGIHVGTTGK